MYGRVSSIFSRGSHITFLKHFSAISAAIHTQTYPKLEVAVNLQLFIILMFYNAMVGIRTGQNACRALNLLT